MRFIDVAQAAEIGGSEVLARRFEDSASFKAGTFK
jgi:hypothetical protein